MPAIAVLPELVQGRIAAGEVVERPASAVKELVENALDAAASRVDVEIEKGGRRRIRVSDDGCGMSRDEVSLAVERFATSKIVSERDLARVTTLGFRGEALPSLAAVAELEITTRRAGSDEAVRLRTEPGSSGGPEGRPGRREVSPAAAPPGTVVEVRGLFSRTPARLKFLRSDTTETSAVAQIVERLALARPDVAFRLSADGRELLAAPAGQSLRERAGSVLGREVARELVGLEAGEKGWLSFEGLVSPPDGQTRRDGKWGFLFLNRRPVRDRIMAHAVRAAYESAIPRGRYPIYVVFAEVDPAQVDVNVHPAKHEVRFRSPGSIHEILRRSVREALRSAGAELAADVVPPGRAGAGSGGPASRRSGPGSVPGTTGREYDLWRGTAGAVEPRGGSFVGESGAAVTPSFVLDHNEGAAAAPAAPAEAGREAGIDGRLLSSRDYRIVGTLRTGYVLVETASDLRIIDPHALHERIIYERLCEAAEGAAEATSQQLLVPEVTELSPAEAAAFDRAREALEKMGLVAEAFGGRTAAVRAVPEGVPPGAAGEILREVLADLEEGGAAKRTEIADRVRKSLACRAAVKLGTRLDPEEIERLIEDKGESGAPSTCPHGRPVWWAVSFDEIARRLGR